MRKPGVFRIVFCTYLLYVMTTTLHAQDYERVKPKEPKSSRGTTTTVEKDERLEHCIQEQDTRVFAEKTRGIVVTGPQSGLSSEMDSTGVEVKDLNLSAKDKKTLCRELYSNYIGKPLNCSLISEIKRSIVAHYRHIDRPLVSIHAPEQKVSDGTIVLFVIESKLGKVTVRGNKHFSEDRYKEYIQVQQGREIFSDTLVSDLDWINRNPFRSSYVVYRKGEYPETTDIELVTTDKFPFRVYVGVDNTGFKETQFERLFVGFNWGDAFFLDQVLSFQFTTSLDFRKFLAYSGNWTIPLPWRHLIDTFGGYATTKTQMTDREFNTEGYSAQGSFRYIIPMPTYRHFLSDLRFGFDYKRTNNNVVFGGQNITKRAVNIWQWLVIYDMTIPTKWVTNYIEAELVFQLGEMLPNMQDKDYTLLRRGAENTYAYGRLGIEQLYHLPKNWAFAVKLKGQLATGALLPSEQLGLGGLYSVRGYDERTFSIDEGLLASFEVRTPSFSPTTTGHDNLLFFAFTDWGMGGNHFKPSNEHKTLNLVGVGPGLRYAVMEYLNVYFDWGYQLVKTGQSKNGNRVNFSVVASY